MTHQCQDMYNTEDGNQTSGKLLCVCLNYSMLTYQHARSHWIITRMHALANFINLHITAIL